MRFAIGRLFGRPVLLLALLVGLSVGLSACVTPPPPETTPEMTFRHLEPFNLRVADIQINRELPAPAKGDITAAMPVSPAAALTRWAEDRLIIAGTSQGTGRFTVINARVVRTDLEVERGLTAVFKKQVNQRYDAEVEAELEILDGRGIRRATVTTKAERTITVREDETVASRRRLLFEMVEKLMAEFDSEMEKNIRRHLTPWLL